jgi:antimicrobial peptide system SdpA family protein
MNATNESTDCQLEAFNLETGAPGDRGNAPPTSQNVAASRWKRIAVTGSLVATFWLIVIVYALHGGMAFNPIALPMESPSVRLFAPQGWKFFTRNPQEQATLVFQATTGGSWSSASLTPNSRFSNGFGLSRRGRAQGIEIGLLLRSVVPSAFIECTTEPASCFGSLAEIGPVQNGSPDPSLCGLVGVAMQRPVPWAWARSKKRVVMPSRVIKMRVIC